ncbi:MAG: PilZ domain-containing protein [Desulfovibrio sp.]|nr:PilZ domain-containing protein [Desulfovibrio sp.]MCA1985765.1 PilZ domain-containing protein [Desulfovibrio sp.]
MDEPTMRPPAADHDPADHDDASKPVRKAFRVPVHDAYALTVRVGEENFGAFDVVEGGVGLFHSRRAAFSVGQELEDMFLMFRGASLPVRGRVAHVLRDDHGLIRYGVEFLDMDEETRVEMHRLVQQARQEYLDTLDDDAPER